MLRALTRGAAKRGARFVWWSRVPTVVILPAWWRWTVELGYAIAAAFMAYKCGVLGGTYVDWPPRLP